MKGFDANYILKEDRNPVGAVGDVGRKTDKDEQG